MTVSPSPVAPVRSDPLGGPQTLSWPFSGGEVKDIGTDGSYVREALAPAGPDEVVARIDAVCICSSDIKIIRMGVQHPLFNARDLAASPVILGHEVALTVLDVGENWSDRFHQGQRLGLQPAMVVAGRRATIGMDLPGGFAQHMRLDARMLDAAGPYVFPIPDSLSAAAGAMLEPYSCVEAAYRPNCRTSLRPGGRLLVVGRPAGDGATLALDTAVARAVLLDAPEGLRAWAKAHAEDVATVASLEEAVVEEFDDIVLCGTPAPADYERLLPRLAVGGLFALVSADADTAPAPVDVARIHYHALSFVGTRGPAVETAFAPDRTRFDLRPGGTTLILGAGGAMGRIHTHRALELHDGPAVVVATSRKGRRCAALRDDFGPLAAARGKTLIVVEDEALEDRMPDFAPAGFDDVVVVAPDVAAVERGAALLRPDGLLVVFSGMPFGQPCRLPLGLVATAGMRVTGSTGSLVADQLAVLRRVTDEGLDLTGNLEAVAGFGALPAALAAVMDGRVCGKVAIYPAALDMPLTSLRDLKADTDDKRWTVADEAAFVGHQSTD